MFRRFTVANRRDRPGDPKAMTYLILKCPHCGRMMVQRGYKDRYWTRINCIVDFGKDWNEKFRAIWMDPKVTNKALERELGLKRDTHAMFHGAYLNGLPFDRGGARYRTKRLAEYLIQKERATWLELAMEQMEMGLR